MRQIEQNEMSRSRLLGLNAAAALGILMLAGCGAQSSQTPAPATKAVAPSDTLPAGSTARAAEEKTGHEHSSTVAEALKARAHSTKLDFSSEPAMIPVGKPVTWTLKISDAKSGAPINDFEIEMTRKMHLIVVKNDLSWFNHVHPTLKGDGTFQVTTELPTEGSYKLYADYTPKGRAQEVPQHEIATGGQVSKPASVALVADKIGADGWMTKQFKAHRESEPASVGGATYQVAMMPMPMPIVAGQDTMLHFQIRDAKGRPLKDLQPYLGTMGHCVILSQDTQSYLHSHPMAGGMEGMKGMDHGAMPGMKMDWDGASQPTVQLVDDEDQHDAAAKQSSPDVMFHTNFPTPGLYKTWGQFKHNGQIITASFVVNAAPASAQAAKSN